MTTRIERKVYPDDKVAYLSVSGNPETGFVSVITENPVSSEYFGPIAINMTAEFARELAYALNDAADDAAGE